MDANKLITQPLYELVDEVFALDERGKTSDAARLHAVRRNWIRKPFRAPVVTGWGW
jgi:hypothetical protein